MVGDNLLAGDDVPHGEGGEGGGGQDRVHVGVPVYGLDPPRLLREGQFGVGYPAGGHARFRDAPQFDL